MSLLDVTVQLGVGYKSTVQIQQGEAGYGHHTWLNLQDEHGTEITFHVRNLREAQILKAALVDCSAVPLDDILTPVNSPAATQKEDCAIAQLKAE